MTIWLVGIMGSGKTTAGSLAAALLDVDYIDLDDEVSEAAGRSIADIWNEDGEEAFRRLESEALRRVAGTEAVVGTGGGAVLDKVSREVMGSSGVVVWLTAEPETLATRVERSDDRPLLSHGGDVVTRLKEIQAERHDAYSEAAHVRIDTTLMTPVEVAERVSKL
jgi:shikimate kinase